MRFSFSFSITVALLSAVPYRFNITVPDASPEKRDAFIDARFTYYDITTGATACGWSFSNNAEVVALNSQFADLDAGVITGSWDYI
ncbi:hypothetical protein ACEPAH_1349 [Sanghuangporus vaninii]